MAGSIDLLLLSRIDGANRNPCAKEGVRQMKCPAPSIERASARMEGDCLFIESFPRKH